MGLLRQQVHNPAFALIPPLAAHHYYNWHEQPASGGILPSSQSAGEYRGPWPTRSRGCTSLSPQREFGEVGGVVSPVPRQQLIGLHEGVCSDDEVGDHVLSRLDAGSALVAAEVLLGATLGTRERGPSADVLAP